MNFSFFTRCTSFQQSVRVYTVFASLLILGNTAAEAAQDPPNILLVIADDMGLDASPCYARGKHKPNMPVLEKFCREGVVFENAYAAPTCSPTRATMMTGRYGFRTGIGTVVRPGGAPGLRLSEQTIFQFLDRHTRRGYAHAVIGKWHLSDRTNGGAEHPAKAGVGYYAGVLRGAVRDYYNWSRVHNGKRKQITSYITSSLTREASKWINRQKKPWFLWLAHVAPHLPLHLPPKNLHSRFELNGQPDDLRARPREYFFAALEAMDKEIGNLLARMPKSIRDNTVVIFMGDNGTPPRVSQDYRRSRTKGTIYEGGVRVPLIVWGKGVLRRGARDRSLINTTDMFATIAELAGVALNRTAMPEDSVSFARLLSRSVKTSRRFAYVEQFAPKSSLARLQSAGAQDLPTRMRWRLRRLARNVGRAIRDSRWKYIEFQNGQRRLYNLNSDPLEQNNLLASQKTMSKAALAALARLKAHLARLGESRGRGQKSR